MGCYNFSMCLDTSGKIFEKYARFVSRYPVVFIVVPVIVCGLLSVGMLTLTSESDLITLYVPVNSRSARDIERMDSLFTDKTDINYNVQSLKKPDISSVVIFKTIGGRDVLDPQVIQEISSILFKIQQFSVDTNGQNITHDDVCGVAMNRCVISGEEILTSTFLSAYRAGNITYPKWTNPMGNPLDLTFNLYGDIVNGTLTFVKVLKIIFALRQVNESTSEQWAAVFNQKMSELSPTLTEIAYSSSTSIAEEFQENTTKDVYLFGISVGLLITFSSLVLTSWNFVSSRVYLATAGIVAVSLGIGASFGLVSSCGLFFVDIIGVMPFLAIGVGVDTMFVILSEWSDHHDKATVEDQLGATLKGCGGSVTIAALTDIAAFFIGISSSFQSIRNFCAYTGVALLFSYICHMTFFLGCLTIHGKRVRGNRHCVTCLPVQENPTRDRSCRYVVCSKSQPTRREDEESYCEQLPRKILSAFVLHPVSKCVISVLFAAYIAISIWGCVNLKQGLELNNLVSDGSYFQKYFKWDTEYFKNKFVLSVVFLNMNYLDSGNVQSMAELLHTLESEPTIMDNSSLCWYHLYANSAYFNTSSSSAFVSNLQSFLPSVPHVANDVEFSQDGTLIKAARCYVFSENIQDTTAQGEFMLRVRELVDASELDAFVFNPIFIFMEQYVSILSGTLLTVGIAIICMFVITMILMPHPIMVVLVTVNMLSISLGIFGFLYICDLTLSSITMIDLIMSVGFSVDFSVHVCHGFVTSGKPTRKEKALDALKTSASPVVNAGLSSLLGVLALAGSQSYVFRAFLVVMVLVICFGLAHSMLLLPMILSVIGPVGREVRENKRIQCRPTEEVSTTFD